MNIKDLEVEKELSAEERAAVRGGSNVALVFGATQYAQNGAGFNLASPVAQVAPQTVTQTDTTVDLASVIASAGTFIDQTKVL